MVAFSKRFWADSSPVQGGRKLYYSGGSLPPGAQPNNAYGRFRSPGPLPPAPGGTLKEARDGRCLKKLEKVALLRNSNLRIGLRG